MADTIKKFRPPKPSPQPWKLEVQEQLDLFEEFAVNDEPTSEFLITEPDDFMDELEFEEAITAVHEMMDTAVERGDE